MQAYLEEIQRFSAEDVAIDNGDGSPIDQKQKELLRQMRSRLDGKLEPVHSDRFLTRFLAAENFHLDKAVLMLEAHLAWREAKRLNRPLAELSEAVPSIVRKHACPPHRAGEDIDGRPVFWDSPGLIDVSGLFHSCREKDIVSYHGMVFMEQVYAQLAEQTIKHDRLVDKMVVIQDMQGFGLRSHRRLMNVLKQVCLLIRWPSSS